MLAVNVSQDWIAELVQMLGLSASHDDDDDSMQVHLNWTQYGTITVGAHAVRASLDAPTADWRSISTFGACDTNCSSLS